MKLGPNWFEPRRCMLSIALLLLASCAVGAAANAETCERFAALTLNDQAQVLASNDRSEPECAAFLLRRLGDAGYDQASRVIANYLDFRWPDREPRGDGGSHMPWEGEVFPGFDALYAIGEKSEPAMLEYLAGASCPALGRKHAVWPFLLFQRNGEDAKAVRLLVRASRARTDPVEAGRLWKAATEAVEMCPTDVQQACQAVLIDGRSSRDVWSGKLWSDDRLNQRVKPALNDRQLRLRNPCIEVHVGLGRVDPCVVLGLLFA